MEICVTDNEKQLCTPGHQHPRSVRLRFVEWPLKPTRNIRCLHFNRLTAQRFPQSFDIIVSGT
jgi:hypothetical protein